MRLPVKFGSSSARHRARARGRQGSPVQRKVGERRVGTPDPPANPGHQPASPLVIHHTGPMAVPGGRDKKDAQGESALVRGPEAVSLLANAHTVPDVPFPDVGPNLPSPG